MYRNIHRSIFNIFSVTKGITINTISLMKQMEIKSIIGSIQYMDAIYIEMSMSTSSRWTQTISHHDSIYLGSLPTTKSNILCNPVNVCFLNFIKKINTYTSNFINLLDRHNHKYILEYLSCTNFITLSTNNKLSIVLYDTKE